MADLIGKRLGPYELTSLIGVGVMASVYQAHATGTASTVAIKVIESRLARNPDFVRRFRREAEAIAALRHPHILKLFDFGQQDDRLYLVMELLASGSLAQLLRGRPLPGPRVARYLDQIASALDYAHGESIIHRDLKPQNVLFDKPGNAILTDFGIARLMTTDPADVTTSGGGIIPGSSAYMAPEQWQSRDVDGRADLYALGVMTYEMLARQTPFSADTPVELMHAHINEPPPPIRAIRPDLPQSVEAVLEKALAKGREARFQSGSAFSEAFRTALTGKVPTWLDVGVPPEPGIADAAAGFSRRRASRRSARGNSSITDRREPTTRRFGLMTIGLVVLIGSAAIVMLFLASRSRDGQAVTPTTTLQLAVAPSVTPTAVIRPTATRAPNTNTAAPAITSTPAPSRTDSATPPDSETPDIPATVAHIIGMTNTALATMASSTPTVTTSFTPSVMAQETETPDIPATVAIIVGMTDTAVALAASPTPTTTPSFTSSATWTQTATVTASLTASLTLTVTPSLPPTETPDIPATVAHIVGVTNTAVALAASPTPTMTPSFTSSATWTQTATATPSLPPTETPDIPATVAHIVGVTNTAVALAASPTPTVTPSFTASATWTQTATATPSLPPTETPDIPATVAVIVGMTDTAVAMAASPTPTVTPSFTPSATWTVTPTPSATLSQTPTLTASLTLTITPSLPPTATPDIPATVAHIIGMTNTAAAVVSQTPSAMPSATETVILTETSTPESAALAITNATSANLRAGPGTGFVRVGRAIQGQVFPVVGRTAEGYWYQIIMPDGRAAWVSAGLMQILPSDAAIPVTTAIPATPAATPTPGR